MMHASWTHGKCQHRISVKTAYHPNQYLTVHYKFNQCLAFSLRLAVQHGSTGGDILAECSYVLCSVVTESVQTLNYTEHRIQYMKHFLYKAQFDLGNVQAKIRMYAHTYHTIHTYIHSRWSIIAYFPNIRPSKFQFGNSTVLMGIVYNIVLEWLHILGLSYAFNINVLLSLHLSAQHYSFICYTCACVAWDD